MIKNTFTVLKKNPKIFLILLAVYVLVFVMGGNTLIMFMPKLNPESVVLTFDCVTFYTPVFSRGTVLQILYAFIMVVAAPLIGKYIFEMCTGEVQSGWVKRAYVGSWWKVGGLVVTTMLATLGVYILTFALPYVLDKFMWIIASIHLTYAVFLNIYIIIAFSAIMYERSFSDGTEFSFKIGRRYWYKLAGLMILLYVPAYLISYLIFGFQGNPFIYIHTDVHWITRIVGGLYSLFTMVILLTYSMQMYIREKPLFWSELRGEI